MDVEFTVDLGGTWDEHGNYWYHDEGGNTWLWLGSNQEWRLVARPEERISVKPWAPATEADLARATVEPIPANYLTYLPDEDARAFAEGLVAGRKWPTYYWEPPGHGIIPQISRQAIMLKSGGERPVNPLAGYLLCFKDPDRAGRMYVVLDVHGAMVKSFVDWGSHGSAESSMSPIDLIGPAAFGKLAASAAGGLRRSASALTARAISGARSTALSARLNLAKATEATMRGVGGHGAARIGLAEAPALVESAGVSTATVPRGAATQIARPAATSVDDAARGLAAPTPPVTARTTAPAVGPSTEADAAVERAFAATFAQRVPGLAVASQVAPHLARGNLGERLATEALAADGHFILSYKPDIRGTSRPGIDMVTIKDGTVYFVDNKALSRSGNVHDVSALTRNFARNRRAAVRELTSMLASAQSAAERALIQSALAAIRRRDYRRVVTNANVVRGDKKILGGVSETLNKRLGIEFINVMR